MKRTIILGGLALVSLVGCGGGNTPGANPTPSPSPTPSSRSALEVLLSGDSATSSKRWRFIAMKPNGNFDPGSGHTSAQEPCGPIYTPLTPDFGKLQGCVQTDYIEFRADGKARVGSTGESTHPPFAESWSLMADVNGPVLSGPRDKDTVGTITGTYRLADEGVSGSSHFIRLTVLTEFEPRHPSGPSTFAFEYVLESFGGTP